MNETQDSLPDRLIGIITMPSKPCHGPMPDVVDPNAPTAEELAALKEWQEEADREYDWHMAKLIEEDVRRNWAGGDC